MEQNRQLGLTQDSEGDGSAGDREVCIRDDNTEVICAINQRDIGKEKLLVRCSGNQGVSEVPGVCERRHAAGEDIEVSGLSLENDLVGRWHENRQGQGTE